MTWPIYTSKAKGRKGKEGEREEGGDGSGEKGREEREGNRERGREGKGGEEKGGKGRTCLGSKKILVTALLLCLGS